MFTVPEAPSYRASLQDWRDYLRLLETKHANDKGVSGAIAEARGVIQSFEAEKLAA